MAVYSNSQLALDLMLKTLISSPGCTELAEKKWTTISRLIPGTTPRQCQKRYEELVKEGIHSSPANNYAFTMTRANSVPVTNKAIKTEGEQCEKGSRPSSAKVKGSKHEKEQTTGKASQRPDSGDQGPVMVIHVCDEAKNLKQDFHCPRDLLISEMKYFAEYLSTDAQRWEEVDISVHCDVQIFDWLMRHVKRNTREVANPPKLEPTNVISILISSDFLKMDSLVQECIEFCHKNMSAIVATPCNMNCINDRLVGRITDLFNHNEADDVKDRKDKFKSKLFAKLVEKLFDPNAKNVSSPENASTLFRCSVCKKILTKTLETKLKCLQSKMVVDRFGHLCYRHVRDTSWDVNSYLLELKSQLKTWRDVYWRLWGTINYAKCGCCGEYFACADLGQCRYHPEPPVYDTESEQSVKAAIGKYECCGVTMLRFDPTQPNKGCKLRDHVISLPNPGSPEALADPNFHEKQRIHDDLLNHRDAVCLPPKINNINTEEPEPNIFAEEEQLMGVKPKEGAKTVLELGGIDDLTKHDPTAKPRLQALTMEKQLSYDDEFGFGESDDEFGDDEETGRVRKVRACKRVTVDPQAILLDAPDFSTTKLRKWDSSRSMRWNQDAQREEDQRRMNEIVSYLIKLRFSPEKMEKLKQKEYAGGLFAKLEAQWKAANIQPPKSNNPSFRNKPRLSQLIGK